MQESVFCAQLYFHISFSLLSGPLPVCSLSHYTIHLSPPEFVCTLLKPLALLCLPYPSLLGPLLPLSPPWSNSSLSTTVSLSQLPPAYNQVLVGLDFFHLILHVASPSKGQVMQQTLRSHI